MKLVSGPGALTDHAGRTVVVPADHAAYEDEAGRIFVKPTAPHGLLRTEWTAATKGDDVPDVRVCGVRMLSDRTVEVVIEPVEFGADLEDEHGEKVAARAVSIDDLLSIWRRTDEAQIEDTITSVLAQLGRLG